MTGSRGSHDGDGELERLFRDSLARHSDDAQVTAEFHAPRRTPLRTWLLPLGAAAAVAAAVAGALLLPPGESSRSEDPGVAADPVPADWRVEAWRGVEVSVPAFWAWGGAPVSDSGGRGGDLLDCGATAIATPEGEDYTNGDGARPYVGRPIVQTDVCQPHALATPTQSYLWLGVALDPGRVDLGDGWIQETIEIAGETVTVASQDDALRRQILDSAKPASAGRDTCTPELTEPPRGAFGHEGVSGDPGPMTVCVYHRDEGVYRLTYATEVPAAAARRFLAPPYGREPVRCTDDPDEYVQLLIPYADALGGGARAVASAVFGFGSCSFQELQPGVRGELLPAKIEPWAVDGVPVTVYGPSTADPWVYDFFIGPQG